MKITLLYDNVVYKEGLEADWGFSCLVEVANTPKILFDTGANGRILLGNMKKLGIDPKSIDEVFISHDHFDHIGGLSEFRSINRKAKVYLPGSSLKPFQIHENIFSTAKLGGIEQSLIVKIDLPTEASAKAGKGLVIIAGCSHPGVGNILKSASQFGKVYALIGGLHGFSEFDLIKDLELICPCHCTSFISEIKRLYPEKYIAGGVGKIIEV